MKISAVFHVLLLLLVTVNLSLADCNRSRTKSRCNKFCSEISWQLVTRDSPQRRFKRSITQQEPRNYNKEDLWNEIRNNSFLKFAYRKSYNDNATNDLVKNYSHVPLSVEEVSLIKAYTAHRDYYDDKDQFYFDLNEDCRNNGLEGGKYQATKAILRNALIKIAEKSKKVWKILYRREPSFLVEKYNKTKLSKGIFELDMFTSTSETEGAFDENCPKDYMYTQFIRPQVGVSIKDFSFYPNEVEVLLIPWYGNLTVESAKKNKIRTSAKLKGPKIKRRRGFLSTIRGFFRRYRP